MNTIPFFTPLWAGIPVVMFMHQLAREVWWYESAFPLNAVGFLAEPIYLRCYRSVPVVTVSASTRDDLKRFGLRGPITVIPEGLEPASHVTVKGTSEPTALYVGRLTPSKRVADIILAFAKFCESVPSARLRLIGDGPSSYVAKLRKLAVDRGVADRVHFLGRVWLQKRIRSERQPSRTTFLDCATQYATATPDYWFIHPQTHSQQRWSDCGGNLTCTSV